MEQLKIKKVSLRGAFTATFYFFEGGLRKVMRELHWRNSKIGELHSETSEGGGI